MNKIIYIFILAVLVIGTYLIYQYSAFGNGVEPASVPVQAEFQDRIVYTTDLSFNHELLKADCQKRNGTFNTCGSSCTQGEICVQVCALTCELGESTKSQ